MEAEVLIVDGHKRLALSRVGDAELGYPDECYPTRLEFVSEHMSARVEALSSSFSAFATSLHALSESLRGEARLDFWSESHFINFSGDGSGRIAVSVEIRESVPSGSLLRGELQIDQSYLPRLISNIRAQFSE
jgi:hypothetical protein